jgi:PAS domain S-box-containing protein
MCRWCLCRFSHSFCQHVIVSGEPLIIPDARVHPLVKDNLAIPDLGVVAYAGIPLTTANTHVIGTFAVIDQEQRSWTDEEIEILKDLARAVMTEINLRGEIVARKQAQERLRLQLDFSTAITTHLGEGVYALDDAGRLTFMNPAAETMLGWTAAELLGKHMHEVVHFQRADGSRISVEACPLVGVLRSATPYHTDDDVFTRKDGSVLPVAYTAAPIVSDGQVKGIVVAFRDIAERKQAEEAIRWQAHLLDSVEQAVIAIDLAGNITYWNHFAETLYGWPTAEAVGQPATLILPTEPEGTPMSPWPRQRSARHCKSMRCEGAFCTG